MKYNNESEFYKDWTTQKLKDEYKGLDEMINVVECYGRRDLLNHLGIELELINRGVEITQRVEFN